jgi:ribosomal protein S18 acetylase RimI-like enzyme
MMEHSNAAVDLLEYQPSFQPDFERLNRLWLESHSLLEPIDLEYLQDPEGRILSVGGQIFFAVDGSKVLGTCAAIPINATVFELAKLSVDPDARGKGLGRKLCQLVIAYATKAGASEVVLTSHTSLREAISLYESLGFQHAALPEDNRYETANVFMRLTL